MRSVRRGRKVYQETVAELGELDEKGRAKLFARRMTGGRCEQLELLEEQPQEEVLPVRLETVSVFGVVNHPTLDTAFAEDERLWIVTDGNGMLVTLVLRGIA